MIILENCLTPGWGGIQNYMYRTVRELLKRHTILPVVPPGTSMVRSRLTEDGIPCFECAVRLRELPLLAARRLASLMDREEVDVIHTHYRSDLPVAAIAKRLSRRKPRLVYTVQMKISHNKKDPYHNFIYGQVDAFITITRQLAEQISERMHPRLRERVQTLYYGTEAPDPLDAEGLAALRERYGLPAPRERDGPPGDAFVVGLFGQKFEGKGQHLLIEALAGMKAEGLPVRGLIVGPATSPGYDDSLQALIDRHGLNGEVTLHGFVERPQHLMQACDAVVLATYQETFGLVLIEAMSVGTAVVGSDAGGVPEIIADGHTGLLFQTRNAGSLREKLTRLHRDRNLLDQLARAGQRSAAERFNIDNHFRQLEKVLRG